MYESCSRLILFMFNIYYLPGPPRFALSTILAVADLDFVKEGRISENLFGSPLGNLLPLFNKMLPLFQVKGSPL